MRPAFLISTIVASFLCGLSACASPHTATDTAATSAGVVNTCINPTRIRAQKIVSDQEIQFTLNDGEVWINSLPRVCPGLKFQQGFTWEVSGTQVCSNQQIIHVKDDGTPCQLGEFTRAPKPA